jgi:hypothetical protein
VDDVGRSPPNPRRFWPLRRIVPGVTFTRVSLPLDLHCKHGHGERERERQPVKTALFKKCCLRSTSLCSATGTSRVLFRFIPSGAIVGAAFSPLTRTSVAAEQRLYRRKCPQPKSNDGPSIGRPEDGEDGT